MTPAAPDADRPRVLAGYDGSPEAANAVELGARLLPGFEAQVVHLWAPPFASAELRRRLVRKAMSLDELAALLEREGAAEAERVAAEGVALARAAGWQAEPLARRRRSCDGRAVLGSVSDMVAHYSPVPVLIVPHPLLAEERQAAAAGPVVVGYDGSAGARGALAAAASLFAGRELIAVTVADDSASAVGAEASEAETVVLDAGRAGRGARAVAAALAGFAAERGAAVIIVGSRGRSAWREILLGSVAMAVLHHAERPVLTVPGADRFAGH